MPAAIEETSSGSTRTAAVAGDLLHRGRPGRDDGSAARHRLEHRQAEALVQRRVHDTARAAVERCELGVGHLAHPAVHVHPSPSPRAHDTQLDTRLTGRVDGAAEVLARLESRDRQHVVAVRAWAVGREGRVDSVRDHPHAVGGHVHERGHLASGELRHCDDHVGGPQHPLEPGAAVEPVPAGEGLRGAQDREVVHRDDRRDRRAERPAEGRAVQDVQRASAASEADRVPDGVADDARHAPVDLRTREARGRSPDGRATLRAARARREPCPPASGRAATCRRRPSRSGRAGA